MTYQHKNRAFAEYIEVVPSVFSQPKVVLTLPVGQADNDQAQVCFMLAGNLLARLFTNVFVDAPDMVLTANPWDIRSMQDFVAELDALSEGTVARGQPEAPTIALSIGEPFSGQAQRSTFVDFGGWVAALDMPASLPRSGIFGALYAACLGTSQCFLHACSLAGGAQRPMEPHVFSLLTWELGSADAGTPERVAIPEAHLVGVGAVGSALVYALGHFRRASGLLHLIDNDLVDEGNLNRYALMRQTDIDRAKVIVAQECLARTGIAASPFEGTFDQFAEANGYHIELLLTPVDSEQGRRHLAAALPRFVLNAATSGTLVTVSRHGFGDGRACLHCLYVVDVNTLSFEEQWARDMGLAVDEVLEYLQSNLPVSEETARRVEQHRNLATGSLAEWVGSSLQSFYRGSVCGQAPVQVGAATVIAPLSFISAAAGIGLAAELVKSGSAELTEFQLDNYFRVDTLFRAQPAFHSRRLQQGPGRCICSDEDYVATYREKYQVI